MILKGINQRELPAMCWTTEVSFVTVGPGTVATGVELKWKEVPAICLTLGYFTMTEAQQIADCAFLDQCDASVNGAVALDPDPPIAFQPLLINAVALKLAPRSVKQAVRRRVDAPRAVSPAVVLLQLDSMEAAGFCKLGSALFASALCTVSHDWRIAWDIPCKGVLVPFGALIGVFSGFPTNQLATFALLLTYDAWRLVPIRTLVGPDLAHRFADDANEMPATCCLSSIGILLIGFSPVICRSFKAMTWCGRQSGVVA